MVEGISRETGLPSPQNRVNNAFTPRPELPADERERQARAWALGDSEPRPVPIAAESAALQEPTDDPFSAEPLDHSGAWIGKDSE